jgi:Zn finger protein HypA/HybF involved in hydrogenase expression
MRNKYTKEQLEIAVASSTTWADVCRKLGVKPMTGSQTHLKKRAVDFNINYVHFVGSAFNKGRTFEKRDALEYCFNGSTINSHRLKEKLIRDGYKEKRCEKCNLTEWLGEEIPLELDHIDGNHLNNEFKNLQIICPNCHAVKTREDMRK